MKFCFRYLTKICYLHKEFISLCVCACQYVFKIEEKYAAILYLSYFSYFSIEWENCSGHVC